MKSRLLIAVSLSLFFSGMVAAQTKLVEKVTKKEDELVIPYEKYVLANGLTLIIHEDHSDPVAHIDVTYHVGSAREEIGKSGFAHFPRFFRNRDDFRRTGDAPVFAGVHTQNVRGAVGGEQPGVL